MIHCKIVPKPSFRNVDDEVFCNKCNEYKGEDEFFLSWVQKQQRQCKACSADNSKVRGELDVINRLVTKLKRRLQYLGHRQIVSGIKRETIMAILQINDIANPEKVERIISPKTFDECFEQV